ncbi:glycosyltransferase [candidate division WOR-3 bacterium]|nr:glycosyltransferase [candidate division WOR-3 bacterium]
MRRKIEDYRFIVGDRMIADIYRKARRLYSKRIVHINSTYQGGGVAEMLSSLVPLMNDAGLLTDWRILFGNPDFFNITKKFHNALQGGEVNLSEIKKKIYTETNENFIVYNHIDQDFVIIHDPQPLPLISFYRKRQPWIWRCHVDLSTPNQVLWDYLKGFIIKYDMAIVSNKNYLKKDLPVEQKVVYPAIDPLSPKNMEITPALKNKILRKFKIPTDKPIITQISRFDKWKDPEGVIEVFKRVKEKVDARLILCGSMAADDPEGNIIYERVKKKANSLIKSGDVLLITRESSILINVLQRISSVIIQKSKKEGFGLVITEALWKGSPVVASNIGGIPLQVIDGETGFLLQPDDLDGFAEKIILLLRDRKLAEHMGQKGKEHVRKNFLITRLLIDYLDIIASLQS